MPLEFRRLNQTGENHQRDVSLKCNQLGDEAGAQLDALAARVAQNEADIALLQTLIVQLRVAAEGSMFLDTPQTTDDADITGTFQTIDQYDTIGMTPRGCTVNTTTGEFTLDVDGSWMILIRINLTHDESNSGRETFLRLFNVTDTTSSDPAPIAIGRNTPGTSDTPVLAFDLLVADESDTFRVEIGGGDTLATVRWQSVNLVLSYQGPLGALLNPI